MPAMHASTPTLTFGGYRVFFWSLTCLELRGGGGNTREQIGATYTEAAVDSPQTGGMAWRAHSKFHLQVLDFVRLLSVGLAQAMILRCLALG